MQQSVDAVSHQVTSFLERVKNMATSGLKTDKARRVVIAVDASKQAEQAVTCKLLKSALNPEYLSTPTPYLRFSSKYILYTPYLYLMPFSILQK